MILSQEYMSKKMVYSRVVVKLISGVASVKEVDCNKRLIAIVV